MAQSVLLDACRSVARLRVEIPYDPISNSVKYIKVNLLIDRYLRYFVQMPSVGTELALLLRDEIEHSLKQTRTRFCGRLRPDARIQPQCQCRSPSYASGGCQRSGRWHDSNVAWGGPRRAWFGSTLPIEVTLDFKRIKLSRRNWSFSVVFRLSQRLLLRRQLFNSRLLILRLALSFERL